MEELHHLHPDKSSADSAYLLRNHCVRLRHPPSVGTRRHHITQSVKKIIGSNLPSHQDRWSTSVRKHVTALLHLGSAYRTVNTKTTGRMNSFFLRAVSLINKDLPTSLNLSPVTLLKKKKKKADTVSNSLREILLCPYSMHLEIQKTPLKRKCSRWGMRTNVA